MYMYSSSALKGLYFKVGQGSCHHKGFKLVALRLQASFRRVPYYTCSVGYSVLYFSTHAMLTNY